MISLSNLLEQTKMIFRKKGPEILIGLGFAGMTTSIVLGIKATPTAMERIQKRKEKEKVQKLTTKEVIQEVWTCYIPTAVTWALSSSCIITASVINERRMAALMAAYSLAETNLKDLTAKTKEILGDKKAEEIFTEVDKERMKRNPYPVSEDDEAVETPNGERLIRIQDPYDRYILSNRTIIDKAVNKLNYQMTTRFEPYISLNEFLREIDSPPLEDVGEKIGWNSEKGLIEVRYSSHWINDHTVRGCYSFANPPEYGYDMF